METIVKPKKRGPREKKYRVYSSSGYKGVYKHSKGSNENPWYANVSMYRPKDGKHITLHLGCFATPELANAARIKFITDLL